MNFITNMKQFTAIEYLAIDIANQFGNDNEVGFRGDKDEFEKRIQWVRDNFKVLEARATEAEEPLLYSKAVSAFRKALQGKPIGHSVALDAVCSGMQLMSVLTGCHKGALITGLIDPEKRYDAYTEVTAAMNILLERMNMEMLEVSRKDAKNAVMTALYGSKATPREIFGDLLPVFYQAGTKVASGAFALLELLRDTWDKTALFHEWVLPDGHQAYVPVTVEFEDRLQVDEFKYTMNVEYTDVACSDYGLANIANVVHSIDAYVLRTVVRKCNYNETAVRNFIKAVKEPTYTQTIDPSINKINELYAVSGMADISALQHINAGNIHLVDVALVEKLKVSVACMVQYTPFEVTTIHDSYAAHPNNCNILRYWYRETLAEIADSTVLQWILNQLHGDDLPFDKDSDDLSNYIRKSNYSLG